MKKHLLFSLMVLFSAFTLNAQTVIEAKQVKAVDSLKLKADWITNIIKDSSLSGATVRNFPSTDAVVKYIANRLAHTVKYTDTSAILSGYVRERRLLDSLTAVQARIQGKLTKFDADSYYPAIQRMLDSLTAVQTRIQGKLTKSDADTYYPAIQRMIDSLSAVQTRIQGKLTKSDADTYYPAIQRMIDSLSAVQTRIQGKLTKSDADTYYPAIQRVLDSLTAMQSRIQTKQPLLGYTAENSANKATDFSTVNNVLYPTVQAVSTYIQSALTGVLKDRGNYDASGNTFPASGGSGSGGAIKTGDMWYISVGGTLGGKAVTAGAWVRSLTDAPGQTAGNWAIADGGFGFVPENVANKSTSTSLGTSNTAYPSQNAVKTYVDNATANASNWNTAYNKRPSSASISSSTFTLTLGDGTTVTASIPTFNQNTTGNAATVTNGVYTTTFNGLGDARYLQLTGGTISGALSGTSATFTSGSTPSVFNTNTGVGIAIENAGASNKRWRMSVSGTDYTITEAGIGDWVTVKSATGNIGFGTANPTTYSLAGKHVEIFSSTGVTFLHNNTNTVKSFYATNESALISVLYTYSNHPLAFGTNNTERGRITSAGRWQFGAPFADDGSRLIQANGDIKAINFGLFSNAGYYYFDNFGGSNFMGLEGGANLGIWVGGGRAIQISGSTNAVTFNNSVIAGTNFIAASGYGLNLGTQWQVFAVNSSRFGVYNIPLGIDVFTLSPSTGAATFSNNVTASGDITGLNFTAGNNYYIRYNGYSLLGRNAADNAYIDIVKVNSSNEISIASGGNATIFGGTVRANHYTNATVSVTSNYTVADGIGVVFGNAASGSFTVTLPTASSWTGRVIYVSQTNCGAIEGSVMISGCTNLTGLNRNRPGAIFISTGSTWYCISNASISPTVCD